MRWRVWWMITLLAALSVPPLSAQGGGQFCVRAFMDRNGNAIPDTGEPPLTYGLGVQLQDGRGVVIASALMDNSPTASQGVICFDQLAAGQYTLSVTSAEYNPTTPADMTVNILADGLPEVFDYGARLVYDPLQLPTPIPTQSETADTERLLVALGGGLITSLLVTLIGVLIFFIVIRPTLTRRVAALPPTAPEAPHAAFMRPPQEGTRSLPPQPKS